MVTSPARRPVLTVLCATADDRPPHLGPVEARAEVRYTDADHLATAVEGADALLLWDFFSTSVRDVWDHADRLTWIHVAAAGVDKLLFPALVDSDVAVTNARGVFDRPIAEFVLGVVLAHAKQLPASFALQRDKRWEHRDTQTIQGRNALVVGTGSIGRETARLLRAVGMEVRGAGRSARSGDPDFGDVLSSAELEQHVGWADHLVLVTPLTDQTRGLVGEQVLRAMKPTAHLVNVGRGPVVDEQALVRALQDGGIAAASLDVFAAEPLPGDSPLWSMPNVVVTPHMSGDASGWIDTLALQFVENAERWLDGRELFNVVDKRLGFVPSTGS
ncbi:MAG: 2-hydroxyacid dehydrogenase [Nocardioidaceae bacterium]|nr:2-hydroxyacid dehydrogenase [Nocardioidaceae bacterium]